MATDCWQYFFSFFSLGEHALDSLMSLINDTATRRISQDLLSPTGYYGGDPSPRGRSTPPPRDSNRATLIPPAGDESGRVSPRLSGDFTRTSKDMVRSSIDFGTRDHSRASFD